MSFNRLSTKKRSGRPTKASPKLYLDQGHEAVEVSLCDEGMCFNSPIKHEIGAVLLVDFEIDAAASDNSLRSEAVVVDCSRSVCGTSYDITVLFTGN